MADGDGGNGLGPLLRRMIEAHGPIDVATFMTVCLAHHRHGYYATRDPLGSAGDFVTAPEISQLFGELVGVALAHHWEQSGRPAPVQLVEVGPGRGTLMADLLRATRHVPGFHAAMCLHLVETSPALRAAQAQRLADARPTWHDALAQVPEAGPILLVANELVDALPIRQLVAVASGWRERRIGLDADGSLAFTVVGPVLPLAVRPDDGAVLELAPAREAWAAEVAARVRARGGLALVIDYGERGLVGDTLQAVRRHRKVDPLETPGEADLTSLVDFGGLARAARAAGALSYGPVEQGGWLRRLGLDLRLEQLCRHATPAQAATLRSGAGRIADASGMGGSFKVLAIVRPDDGPPPGFSAGEEAAP